jgi:hypothetical protein
METWINSHPWMTFFLGFLSILTLNTLFISLGGGYKKPAAASPAAECQCKKKAIEDEEQKIILN